MSNTLNKIIKYIFIFAIIGAIVFFGMKFLFPQPSATQAFESTQSLVENNLLTKLVNTNQDFITLFSDTLGPDGNFEDQDMFAKKTILLSANITLKTQLYSLDFALDELIFAQNSATYNSNTTKLRKISTSINTKLEEINSYITNYTNPVLTQENTPTKVVLNSICVNLTLFNNQIINLTSEYMLSVNAIFSDLQETYTVNQYSKKNFQIVTAWQQAQAQLISDTSNFNEYNKLEQVTASMFEFAKEKLSFAESFEYTQDIAGKTQFLNSMSKANLHELVKALPVHQNIQAYLDQIEQEDVKNSTTVLYNFLTGGKA